MQEGDVVGSPRHRTQLLVGDTRAGRAGDTQGTAAPAQPIVGQGCCQRECNLCVSHGRAAAPAGAGNS